MSANDRLKKQFGNAKEAIEKLTKGDHGPFDRYLKTIRSKTLRVYIAFACSQLDDYNFMITMTPKEISKALGIGERKVYDLIKVDRICGEIQDKAFTSLMDKISQLSKENNNGGLKNEMPNA